MWTNSGNKNNFPGRGFSTPPPSWKSRPFRSPKAAAFSERKRSSSSLNSSNKSDLFHVIHKVPAGDSPYVKAKQVQLIDKDPSRAISLFWAAINTGDRVDSALKDMAVVMKQLDRSDEAIEAIKSFRHLCPYDSQESIDNVLIELYKRSGRIEEEIDMLQCKLKEIEEGSVFGGKRTKPVRSQGKKVQITIDQEKSRVLGNLAWAFLQLDGFYVAEDYYRKALSLESDNNKKCNLAICLILTNRLVEAKSLLQSVRASSGGKPMKDAYAKSFERASHMLDEKESKFPLNSTGQEKDNSTTMTTITSKGMIVTAGTSVSSQFTASTRRSPDDEEMDINENSRRYENKTFGAVSNSFIPIKMKSNQEQDGLLRTEDESFNCSSSLYSSPILARRNAEVPFTQPKNSIREFNIRHGLNDQRQQKGTAGGSSSRKVLFKNPSMKDQSLDNGFAAYASSESEGTQTPSNYDPKYKSAATNAVELGVPFTQPRSCSLDINGGHQRKATMCFRGSPSCSIRKLSFEPPASTENTRRSELSTAVSNEPQHLDAVWKQISCGDIECEEAALPKEEHNSSTVGGKKSWADMVEEEEDVDDEKEVDTSYETLSSRRCKVKVNQFGGDWSSSSDNEEFNDENLNSNILHQDHSPSKNLVEVIKFGSLDIKDVAKDSVLFSSRNPVVRRSLYFDEQPILDFSDNRSSSLLLLPRKDLATGENVNLTRRNRLQVFQEITVHQELEC